MAKVRTFRFDRIIPSAIGEKSVGDLCMLIARLEADGFGTTARILRRQLGETLGAHIEDRG